MRHLAIVTTGGGPFGGLETFVRGLVDWLLDDGWRITVALSGYDFLPQECRGDRLSIDPVNWVNVADLSGDRHDTRAAVADRLRWFRRVCPDAALFVQSSNTPLRASVLAARLAGVPVVTTQRTMPARLPQIPSKRHVFGLIPGLGLHRRRLIWSSRFTAHLAHRVVYNSHAVRALYETEYGYPASRGVMIPNAVQVNIIHTDDSLRQQPDHMRVAALPKGCPLPGETPGSDDSGSRPGRIASSLVVGYVGRLGREKHLDILLRALAALPRELHIRAELFGDGPERDALVRLAEKELGLSDRVRFGGPTGDAAGVYDRFDAVVLCSPRESSSNMVLEAMAAGKPVVVTRVGGLPELIGDGEAGLCVEPLHVNELAAALQRLALNPQERDRLGRAGRQRARTHHHPDRIRAAWIELLHAAAHSQRTGRFTPRGSRMPARAQTRDSFQNPPRIQAPQAVEIRS